MVPVGTTTAQGARSPGPLDGRRPRCLRSCRASETRYTAPIITPFPG